MKRYNVQCLVSFAAPLSAAERSAVEGISSGEHFAGHEEEPTVAWTDDGSAIIRLVLKGPAPADELDHPTQNRAEPEDTVCRTASAMIEGWLQDVGLPGSQSIDCQTPW